MRRPGGYGGLGAVSPGGRASGARGGERGRSCGAAVGKGSGRRSVPRPPGNVARAPLPHGRHFPERASAVGVRASAAAAGDWGARERRPGGRSRGAPGVGAARGCGSPSAGTPMEQEPPLCLGRAGGRWGEVRGPSSRARVLGGWGRGSRARRRLVARSRHYAGRHFLSDPGEEREAGAAPLGHRPSPGEEGRGGLWAGGRRELPRGLSRSSERLLGTWARLFSVDPAVVVVCACIHLPSWLQSEPSGGSPSRP